MSAVHLLVDGVGYNNNQDVEVVAESGLDLDAVILLEVHLVRVDDDGLQLAQFLGEYDLVDGEVHLPEMLAAALKVVVRVELQVGVKIVAGVVWLDLVELALVTDEVGC